MDKIEKLVSVLKKINAGVAFSKIKGEAKELLEQIDATELSLAEQKLIEQGMKPEDLRGLCAIHMEMLDGELNRLKASVAPGHPLHTLIAEHDELLKFLDNLDGLNSRIQWWENMDEGDINLLKHLAEQLVSAERHHKREEDALFPALESIGITGPLRIMRMEHDELRLRKRNLLSLADEAHTFDIGTFKSEVGEHANYIVFNLRDHIFKENHILYPSALQNIKDESQWAKIKEKCDTIGYCSFSPAA